MTLNDRKGNIRGREFPTDTGIDGNACEETTKDQRWVGLCRQIPDTDTHNQPLSFSLSVSFLSLPLLVLSLSYTTRAFFLSLSLPPPAPTRLTSLIADIRPFVRTIRSIVHSRRNVHCHDPSPFPDRSSFHNGNPVGSRLSWK